MKKLMTALAAVAVAAVAQAASINWGIANSAWTLNDGSRATAGYTVYLINGATELSTIMAAIDNSTGAFSVDQDWVFASGTTSGSKGKVSETTATTDKLTKGVSYDFSVLIVDATNTSDIRYMVSATYAQAAYLSGEEEMAVSFAATRFGVNALTYDATSAANGWAAVPEPTSGLLLLLGMAGLALNRKRA